MSKTYVTYSSTAKHPLNVRFACPACGAENVCELNFETSAAETYRGGLHYDSQEAEYSKLGRDAINQTNERAKALAYGYAHGRGLMNASGKPAISLIICPKCETAQVPECCKDQKHLGTRKGCITSFLIWIAFAAVLIVSLVTWVNTGTAFGLLMLAFCSVSVLVVFLGYRRERARTKQAISDPAMMKKYYNATFNDNIEFDFTPYGLGIVRAGQDKLMGKERDIFITSGTYFCPGASQGEEKQWSVSSGDPRNLMIGLVYPVPLPLKDIAAIEACDFRGRGASTCIRLAIKNGEAHILDVNREADAQKAVSQLAPLWQDANRPV
jgi:hypothetical protein